jgi:type I restriction enzyme S subunit
VVSTVRTYLRAIAQVPQGDEPLVFSTGFAVLEAKPAVDHRFLSYICQSEPFVGEVVARSVGVSYPAINPGDLGSIIVALPSLSDQRRIADFLDAETSRIDYLTSYSQRQQRVLDEKFIESVRVGTTGVVGRRIPTGVQWMPEIQDGWTLRKVGREFKTSSGTTPNSEVEAYFDGPYPWVNSSDLPDGEIRVVERTVTKAALEAYPALRVQPVGALIIALYGQGETKGRTGVLTSEACLNQACCALIRVGRIVTEFAAFWFRAHKAGVISLAYGAGQPNLSQELIRRLMIPVPDVELQELIVAQLRIEEAEYQVQSSALAQRCELLAERRQAIITAAVTGQIDVTTARGVSA